MVRLVRKQGLFLVCLVLFSFVCGIAYAGQVEVVAKVKLGTKGLRGVGYGNGIVYVADKKGKKIFKVDASKVEVIGEIPLPGTDPRGLAYDPDDNCLWHMMGDSVLYKLSPEDGKVIAKFSLPEIKNPRGVGYKDGIVWISDKETKKIYKFDKKQEKIVGSIPVDMVNPTGVALKDGFLYQNDVGAGVILKINLETGEIVDKYEFAYAGTGLAFEGDNLWFSSPPKKTLYKLSLK